MHVVPSRRSHRSIALLAVLFAFVFAAGAAVRGTATVSAQPEPKVQGILFFDPSCENCESVMANVLPPLVSRFGDDLKVYEVNVSLVPVFDAWSLTNKTFDVPPEKKGVPTLVIGDQVLSGEDEIGARLPGIVEDGMAGDGIGLPPVLGLTAAQVAEWEAASGGHAGFSEPEPDPVANGLAIVVLGGMVLSLAYVGAGSVRANVAVGAPRERSGPAFFAIPVLAVLGMAVAGYLSYIKLTSSSAICPIGNCDAVQHSPWAQLFGIPVAYLGVLSYAAIFVLWIASAFGDGSIPGAARRLLFLTALFGTLFSVYLTFLEPVVIKEVCLWCLVSAVVMTAILLASYRALART